MTPPDTLTKAAPPFTVADIPLIAPPAPLPVSVVRSDRDDLTIETQRQPGGTLDPDSWTVPTPARVGAFMAAEPDQARIDATAYSWLQDGARAKATGTGGGIDQDFKAGLQTYVDGRKARGEQPFQYLQHARTRAEERDAREQVPFFRTLFSAPEKMANALPAEHRQAFEDRFKGSLDPIAEKQQTAGIMLVSSMLGKPADEVAELWPVYRQRYGNEHLGLSGKVDDAGFYRAAGQAFEQETKDDETARDIAQKAQQSAIQGRPLADVVTTGKELTGDRWKQFEPAARAAYAGVLSEFRDREIKASRGLFEAVADMQGKKVVDIAQGDGTKAAWVVALENYGTSDQATRDRMMALIGLQAQAEGEDINNYFERIGAAVQSGNDMLASGIGSLSARSDTKYFAEITAKEPDPEKRKQMEAQVNYMKGKATFSQDLQTAGVKVRKYIDAKRDGFWDTLGDYGVMAAESLPLMAASAIPYGAALPVVMAAYSERDLSTFRREAPNASEASLVASAYASGAIEAGIDRLQWLTLGARLPNLSAKLLTYGKPGAVAVAAARAGVVTVAETGQEVLQDITPSAVQSVASALNKDIPGVQWETVLSKEMESLGDIAGVSMIFGVIGGAGSTIADHIAAPRLKTTLQDRDGMALSGFSSETIEEVATLAETHPAEAAEALKGAMIETPMEERRANAEAARARLEADGAEITANADASIPTMEKQADSKVQVNFPDSPAVLVDDNEQALEAVRNWEEQESVDTTKAVREYIDHLTDYHASNPEATFTGKQTGQEPTLETWAGDSKSKIATANARIDIMMRQAGTDMGIERPLLSDVPILGTSRNIRAGAVTRMVAEIHKSGNPLTVIEEAAEAVGKWLMADSKVSESKMIGWIRTTEQQTNQKILADNLATLDDEARAQEIAEGFSYIARNNAVGKIQDSALPSAVKAFFRAFKEQIAAVLRLATDFARLRTEGRVNPEFAYWLDVAAGLDPDFQMENLTRQMEAEMQAEAMEGFVEVQDALKGRLPLPETLEAAGDPLAGEVRRLWEGMMANPDNGASKSARTRKVNEFFLPKGQTGNLDEIRRSLGSSGFDFTTPAEMLEAADLSINSGRKQYGTTDTTEEEDWQPTFSIGRTGIKTTPATQLFEGAEGSPSVIGPVTFSIGAFHGTPHAVDKFTTDKIGTGEGAQAYGWGLYFAESRKVATQYREVLGSEFRLDGELLLRAGNYGPKFEAIRAELGDEAADIIVGFIDQGKARVIDELNNPLNEIDHDTFDKAQDIVDRIEAKNSGNLYTVTLDAKFETLLDWDELLDHQPEAVRAALEASDWFTHADEQLSNSPDNPTGRDLHRWLSEDMDPEEVSAALKDAGIPGIKYLDGDSRALGRWKITPPDSTVSGKWMVKSDDYNSKGLHFDTEEEARAMLAEKLAARTFNYVVFDDSLIHITEENGTRVETHPTFAIAVKGDPLLAAIEARIKSPEKKAETYKKMKARVSAVKRRFEDRRLRGEFDTEGGDIDQKRFEQIRDIATLEAIGKSLPPEIRGKIVGSFRKVADLKTTKGRAKYMTALLPRIENALESMLKRHFRTAIRRQMKQAAFKVADSRTRGGKIGALGHSVFEEAKAAMKLTDDPSTQIGGKTAAVKAEDKATELRDQLEGTPDLTDDQIAELDGRIQAVELFGDYGNANSARLEQALGFLNGVYSDGREEWLSVLKSRRDWRNSQVVTVEGAMGRFGPATDAERNAARQRSKSLLTRLDEGVMQGGLSGSQKIRRLSELTHGVAITDLTNEMEMAFHEAENAEADMNHSDNEALATAMTAAFGVKSQYSIAKKLRELTATTGPAPVEKIEGHKSETVKVPVKYVEAILAGEMDALEAGGEKFAQAMRDLDDQDLAQLELAWEQFTDLPEADQAKKRNITFDRTIASGTRQTIGEVNQLEGLQLYLTMKQPDQAVKLARLGYDEETLAQLEAWLKPETLALGAWMVDHIGAEAFTLDSIHRAEKGVGLKLVENYFPVRNDVAGADNSGLSINGGVIQHTGKSIGAIKERVSNNAPPAYVNAIAVFLANRAQVNFWKSHVAPIREWGGVIRDERFASAVKNRMGETYYGSLDTLLKRIESGGALNAAKLMDWEKLVKNMTSNFAVGTLGARVSTLAVNLSAGLNVALEMPAHEIAAGFADVLARPEAFKDAFNSPAIQRRLAHGASYEAQLAKTSGLSTVPTLAVLNSWAQKGVTPINYVDTGANVIGAAIAWEYTRKQSVRAGLSDEEARAAADKQVTRLLLRAAQPAGRLAKSELELKVAESPLAALFTLFTSEPRKTLAILYLAGRELATGKGTYGKPMAAQQLFVAFVVFQTADFLIRQAYAALAKADDDEPEDPLARLRKRITDPKAWGYALTTSHLRSVPIAGEVWSQGMGELLAQKTFTSSQNPLNRATRTVITFKKPETTEEAIAGGIKILQGVAPVIPGGPVFGQGGNAAEFVTGVATSNGVSFSDEDRVKRIKSRFSKFKDGLEATHGKTQQPTGKTGTDGKPATKTDKKIQAAKNAAMIDRLHADLAPLAPALQKKALDAVSAPEDVKTKAAKLLTAPVQ